MTYKIFHRVIILSIFILGYNLSYSQHYFSDDNIHEKLEQAENLFLNKKYAAAQEKFHEIRLDNTIKNNTPFMDIKAQASFKEAVCAFYLKSNNTEFLLKKFIDQYSAHSLSNHAQLFLGRFYFNKKKHKKTINSLLKINTGLFSTKEKTEWNFMLGYAHFFKKQFTLAKSYFEQIKNTPSDYYFSTNYYLGYMAYYDKDYDEALIRFYIVNNSNMYGTIVPYYIAQIYYIKEDYEKVIEFALPLLAKKELKYFESTENIIGQSYFKLNEYAKALPFQKKFVEDSKEVLKSDVYNLGYCYYQLKQYEPALFELLKLTDSKDSLAQNANYLLGDCFLKLNDKQSARNAFKKAYLIDFDLKIKEEASFNFAKLTYELQFHGEAISSIQSFLEEFPQSKHELEANELLTVIFLETRDYGMAIVVIEGMKVQSAMIKKAYQKVSFYRGVELFNDRQLNDAIDYFDKCLANPFDNLLTAKAFYWKGEAHYQAKRYEDAIENFERFIEVSAGLADLEIQEAKSFALYNIAYCYYNQDKYKTALTYYENAIKAFDIEKENIEASPSFKKSYPDSYLRNADCHFIMKNYKSAINSYQLIIDHKFRGIDYALFQQAVLYGLIEPTELDNKVKNLQFILANYEWSIYIDDATFELGDTYYNINEKDSAIIYFTQVVDQFPGSNYGRKALLKLALIYFNMENYTSAEKYCIILLKEFATSQEAREAINIMKEIYIAKGEASNFFALLRDEFPEIKISLDEQDSISYFSAEAQYINEHFEASKELFDHYLIEFENGFFQLNAHFYRGQCLFRSKAFEKALVDYEFVLKKTKNKFTETSLYNAAYIYDFVLKNPNDAIKTYEPLVLESDFQEHQLTALNGLVRNYFLLKNYDKVIQYANETMLHSHANETHKETALLYKGKSLLALDSLESALIPLQKVAKKSQNEAAIDSRYHIALIRYKKEEYDTSLAQCFYIINNLPSYEFWVAKTFILLADNYYQLDNSFQAKATLQSIIDYYDGDELKRIAQAKLDHIILNEIDTTSILMDSVIIQNDSVLVEDTLEIITELKVDAIILQEMKFDTLILDGDTILLEIDNPVKKEALPTTIDSIEVNDSVIIKDTILPIDTIFNNNTESIDSTLNKEDNE